MQKGAAAIAKNLHVARYELLRPEWTKNSEGGFDLVPTVIETGRCSLAQRNVQGQDRMRVAVEAAVGPYVAELPITSVVQAADQLRITVANRDDEVRTFDIIGQPLKGDDMEMFITVNLEIAR